MGRKKIDLGGDLKVLMFDIEQCPHPEHIWKPGAGFKADHSLLLSAAVYDPATGESLAFHLDKRELTNYVDITHQWDWHDLKKLDARQKIDLKLSTEICEYLNENADVIVTWYGTNHDIKYMNTKALMAGTQPLVGITHCDLFFASKHKMSMSSNRLGRITQVFTEEKKGNISPARWDCVRNGDYKSLLEIVDYNIQDVVSLADVFKKFRPFLPNFPHSKLRTVQKPSKDLEGVCKWCGGTDVVHNGHQVSLRSYKPKWYCKECKVGFVW